MNINDMVGKVFTSVTQDGGEMVFANETERFRFFHYQDCCESVTSMTSLVTCLT